MQRKHHFEFFSPIKEHSPKAYSLSGHDLKYLAQALHQGDLTGIQNKFGSFSSLQKQAFFNTFINYNDLYNADFIKEPYAQGFPLELAGEFDYKEIQSYFKKQMQNLPAYVTHFFREVNNGEIEIKKWSYWKRDYFISTHGLVRSPYSNEEEKQTKGYKK